MQESRKLYLEELLKKQTLTAANASQTERVHKLEAQVDDMFAATLVALFSEDTDTRMKELAKENSKLRARCLHAAKRAAILEGIEEKNCTLQAELTSLRNKLSDSLGSYEDCR